MISRALVYVVLFLEELAELHWLSLCAHMLTRSFVSLASDTLAQPGTHMKLDNDPKGEQKDDDGEMELA